MGIKESSVGDYVAKAAQIIEESGLNYQITAMGTQIESDDLKTLYEVCREVQESIFEMGVGRVYTVLKIDDRRDKENRTLDEKVKSVKSRLEKEWKLYAFNIWPIKINNDLFIFKILNFNSLILLNLLNTNSTYFIKTI